LINDGTDPLTADLKDLLGGVLSVDYRLAIGDPLHHRLLAVHILARFHRRD